MNRFYLLVGIFCMLIVSSVGATVLYIHNKQANDEINKKLSEALQDQMGVSGQEGTLSGINNEISPADSEAKIATSTSTKPSTTSAGTKSQSSTSLDTTNVGKHNTKSSCWLIISTKVYDVTKFLDVHPGGVTAITPYCGKDATNAFNSNSVGHNHSSYARSLLPTYFVGNIGDSKPLNSPPTTQNLSSTKFNIGDIVKVSSDTNVRSTANISGVLLGKQPTGRTGIITSGPINQGGFNWWKIDYGSGVDGWSVENYLVKQDLPTSQVKIVTPTPTPSSQTQAPGYTTSKVALHNTQDNCWIIISNKIYNVTSFLTIHPGGTQAILQYCGKDATNAFNSNSVGHNHSSYARSLLPTYYLFDLVDPLITPTPTSAPTPTITPSTTPTPTPTPTPIQSGNTYTTSTVSSHNTQSNCWIIISNSIYNVTSFLSIHPGGIPAITPYCGGDATNAFNSNSVGHNHSSYARSLLPTYFVGSIGATVTPTPTPTPTTSSTPTPTNSPTPTPTPTPTINASGYTTSQVASHNTQSDCWIIISSKIYNVTSFMSIHPGGVAAIRNYCGQDATNAFNSNSVGHNHSAYARSLLPTYYVGDITTQVSPTPTPTPNTSSTPTPTPTPTSSVNPTPTPTSTSSNTPTSYNVTVTGNGTITPASLTINAGDTVVFNFSGSGEAYLTFSPSIGSTLKLDSEFRTKSHTFDTPGTWNYHRQDGAVTNATITVQ